MMKLIVSLLVMCLLLVSVKADNFLRASATSACTGCTTVCSIYSTQDPGFPCYQGTPADASKTYYTDPALPSTKIWACTTCLTDGYPFYLRNDPVYTNMELWSMSSPAPTFPPTTAP